MDSAKKISCIVCAFNEEQRIGAVLSVLANHPLLAEIIVIDDGSTDNTQQVVLGYPTIKLISCQVNKGKSSAMSTGIINAQYDTLMFIDADLTGLTPEAITSLAEPVLKGHADVSLSIRKNSLKIYKLIGLDFVSGERVIAKKILLNHIEDIKKLPGFGIEVFMNELIIKDKLRVKTVVWKEVCTIRKTKKVGFWKGLRGEINMISHITSVISYSRIIYQNYALLKLKTKL